MSVAFVGLKSRQPWKKRPSEGMAESEADDGRAAGARHCLPLQVRKDLPQLDPGALDTGPGNLELVLVAIGHVVKNERRRVHLLFVLGPFGEHGRGKQQSSEQQRLHVAATPLNVLAVCTTQLSSRVCCSAYTPKNASTNANGAV